MYSDSTGYSSSSSGSYYSSSQRHTRYAPKSRDRSRDRNLSPWYISSVPEVRPDHSFCAPAVGKARTDDRKSTFHNRDGGYLLPMGSPLIERRVIQHRRGYDEPPMTNGSSSASHTPHYKAPADEADNTAVSQFLLARTPSRTGILREKMRSGRAALPDPSTNIERQLLFNQSFGSMLDQRGPYGRAKSPAVERNKENIECANRRNVAQLQNELREAAHERARTAHKPANILRSRSFGASTERSRSETRQPRYVKLRRSSTVRSERPKISTATFEQPDNLDESSAKDPKRCVIDPRMTKKFVFDNTECICPASRKTDPRSKRRSVSSGRASSPVACLNSHDRKPLKPILKKPKTTDLQCSEATQFATVPNDYAEHIYERVDSGSSDGEVPYPCRRSPFPLRRSSRPLRERSYLGGRTYVS